MSSLLDSDPTLSTVPFSIFTLEERNLDIPLFISCEICKKVLDSIMYIILHECKFDVFGYDKVKDEYWVKKQHCFMFFIKTENEKVIIYPSRQDSKIVSRIVLPKIKELIKIYLSICKMNKKK
jgi:hypothetical protein